MWLFECIAKSGKFVNLCLSWIKPKIMPYVDLGLLGLMHVCNRNQMLRPSLVVPFKWSFVIEPLK